jgi:hypothetical protein
MFASQKIDCTRWDSAGLCAGSALDCACWGDLVPWHIE